MDDYRFIEPVDVLYLRGNKLFGNPGDHGEALMPPWPSIAAGSLRTRMLVDQGEDPTAYGLGRVSLREPLHTVLGTPDQPGTFRISFFTIGGRAGGEISLYFPLPSDGVVDQKAEGKSVSYMRPSAVPGEMKSSFLLEKVPVLRRVELSKPVPNLWLTQDGLQAYLNGMKIHNNCLVQQHVLWRGDQRLGIALDGSTRTAATGRIYTAETIAMAPNHGFLVGVEGAHGLLPDHGLVRIGGDGRGASLNPCHPPQLSPPWDRIISERRFKMVLATPGIFEGGWLLSGIKKVGKKVLWEWDGIQADLVSAALRRFEVASGWDLAHQKPKPAIRVVTPGSVYWLENFEGHLNALQRIVAEGLWSNEGIAYPMRRAEGFNNVFIAAWPEMG